MDITLLHENIEITILDGVYVNEGKPTFEAIEYYKNLTKRINDFRCFAAENLLDCYNETWFTEEIGLLNKQQFMEKLTNPSICIYDEIGVAYVYFDDGGIFGGHSIEILVENGVLLEAEIAG